MREVKKKNSYTVLLDSNDIFEIETFIVIKIDETEKCYALGYYFSKSNVSLARAVKLDYMMVLKEKSKDLAVVRCSSIVEKVIIMEVGKLGFVACKHPTRNERLV